MSRFKYYAFDENNDLVKSTMVEDDLDIVTEKLAIMNHKVIRIKKVFSFEDLVIVRTLKSDELANFCGQVGIIIDSGVTILRGIDILVQQTEDRSYKKVLNNILTGIKKGLNLSIAMKNTGVFPELLTDMIGSGEMSGNLPELLFSMEDFYSREAQIKAKIKSASVYPMILLASSVLMVLFFNFFVFSELKSLFDDVKDMPKITAMLIGSLEYLNHHPIKVGVVIGVIVIAFNGIKRIDQVEFLLDRISLKIPVFGQVKMEIITSRITSSMAIFIKSAIPLVKVMTVMESLADNQFIAKKISIAKEEIIRGESIASAFEDCQVFDPMMIQMMKVGEETGKLEEMLFRLASIYEKKCNIGIGRLVAMIEPVFTLIVGVGVGFVIVAMALPIFQMSSMY